MRLCALLLACIAVAAANSTTTGNPSSSAGPYIIGGLLGGMVLAGCALMTGALVLTWMYAHPARLPVRTAEATATPTSPAEQGDF
jgi:hypothetical protein